MKPPKLFAFFASLWLFTGCSSTPPPGGEGPVVGKLKIITATYGSGTQYADVTAQVVALLHTPSTEFFARPQWLKADPTPGWNKALTIIYENDGQRKIYTTGEGGRVTYNLLLRNPKK